MATKTNTGEDILEPDLPIIDPHHHLWVRGAWRYMLDDLLDTSSGHNIVTCLRRDGQLVLCES